MFGERRAQESRVRCVVRARVGVFEPEVGDDRQLILDRFQRGKDGRQLAERALPSVASSERGRTPSG